MSNRQSYLSMKFLQISTPVQSSKSKKVFQHIKLAQLTRVANKVIESKIHGLRDSGCSEEEIFEPDALDAQVEGFQEVMAQWLESQQSESPYGYRKATGA